MKKIALSYRKCMYNQVVKKRIKLIKKIKNAFTERSFYIEYFEYY